MTEKPSMLAMVGAGVASAALLLVAGCARNERRPWTPEPIVGWNDLSTRSLQHPRNGYRIVADAPTHGIFPTSMAVVRVATLTPHNPRPAAARILYTDPRNEYIQWNSALDDLMAVSEVFPITDVDLGGGRVEPEQILAAFRALGARLGLVYALNEVTDGDAVMIAVLYDTQTQRPLATLHTYAYSLWPIDEKSRSQRPPDRWVVDARARVRARFEELLHDCIHELIQEARPAKSVIQVDYRPTDTPRSFDWPPRQRR
ncbi:MAG: hypothetical protein ACE5EX_05185 [Phycisphaerae bacterium]